MERLGKYPGPMPDTIRTRAIADVMNAACDNFGAQGMLSPDATVVRNSQMEEAGAEAARLFDLSLRLKTNPGLRRAMAYVLAPEVEHERRRMERDAEVDPLTGLANRRAMEKALPHANFDSETAVIMLDGDGFGRVNKLYNHAEGDKVIVDLAHSIKETAVKFGCGERVFRRAEGGDEFIVLTHAAQATELLAAITDDFGIRHYGEATVSVTGAVGADDKQANDLLAIIKQQKKQQQAA